MKNYRKRILSIAIAATLSMCAIPQTSSVQVRRVFTASAEDSTVADDFTYTINVDGNGIIITAYNGSATDVVIPNEINGNPVTEIDYGSFAYFNINKYLTSVVLPKGLTQIGDSAFSGQTKLKALSLPDQLITIGAGAFSNTGLTEIAIPESVTEIGSQAFSSSSQLGIINIPENIVNFGADAFRNTKWLTEKQNQDPLVVVNGVLIDGKACTGDVIVPDGVKSIAAQAFSQASSTFATLTSIVIPDSVTSIGESAFANCSSLSEVTLSKHLESIGVSAFSHCNDLKEMSIPNSVISIGGSAFLGCDKLQSVSLPTSLNVISNSVFCGCSMLSDITIPENVKAIDVRAFSACSSLKEIVIPDGVESIGYQGFAGCSSLEKVTVPDSVTSFGPMTFSACPKLTVYGNYGSVVKEYANSQHINFKESHSAFTDASLTLSDDLGLNFFLDDEIVNDSNADNFRVKLSGGCYTDEATVEVVKKNSRYCATANVSADNMDENITATLEKNSDEGWKAISEYTYSVNQYLDSVETESQELKNLVNTVKKYGDVSKAYFNDPENIPAVADHSAEYKTDTFKPAKNDDDMISLVLDSKLAARLYIDGLSKGATASYGTDKTLNAKKGANGKYCFEVDGINPKELAKDITIKYGESTYTFKPLSWCYLVQKNGGTGKNKAMADILFEYYTNAVAYDATLNS